MGLKVATINIRGLSHQRKQASVIARANLLHLDVLAIQEMKTNDLKVSHKDWVWKSSLGPAKQWGVSLLVKRRLCGKDQVWTEICPGLALAMSLLVDGMPIVIVTVYFPCRNQPEVSSLLDKLSTFLRQHDGTEVFLLGDFNRLVSASLRARLQKLLRNSVPCDVWSHLRGSTRGATFQTGSRLDRVLMRNLNTVVIPRSIRTVSTVLSDHCFVVVELKVLAEVEYGPVWKLKRWLLKDPVFMENLTLEMKLAVSELQNAPLLSAWDPFKARLVGAMEDLQNPMKKRSVQHHRSLLTPERRHTVPSDRAKPFSGLLQPDDLAMLAHSLEGETEKILNDDAWSKNAGFRDVRELWPSWNQKLKPKARLSIAAIKAADGTVCSSDSDILGVFTDYFQEQFGTKVVPPSKKSHSSLYSTLRKIDQANDEVLCTPITGEEVTATLGSTENGKASGLDGWPVELYVFLDDTVPCHHQPF